MATKGGLPRVRGIAHVAHVLSASYFTPQVNKEPIEWTRGEALPEPGPPTQHAHGFLLICARAHHPRQYPIQHLWNGERR